MIFYSLLLYYFQNIWTDIKNYRYYLNEMNMKQKSYLKLDILTYNELRNFNHFKMNVTNINAKEIIRSKV